MSHMRRREFITLLGGAVVAWPFATRAQQPNVPIVGSLNAASARQWANFMGAFRRGLADYGFVDRDTVQLEYRWADGHYEQLPTLAADLVDRKVAVIFASGGVIAVQAAKAATNSIPIVFTSGLDPAAAGLVASMNRPEGNLTGVSLLADALAKKRLELLNELVPKARVLALLIKSQQPARQTSFA